MDNTYEKKIVKIQSLYRGKLTRKKIEYDHMKELSEFVVNLNGLVPVLQRGFVSTLGSGIANVPEQSPFASDVNAAPLELPVGVTWSDTAIESKKT